MAPKKETRHHTITGKLLKEALPFLTGEPQVRVHPIGESVKMGEQASQLLKARLPFMKGKLRPDLVVSHTLPTNLGECHVVHTYSGSVVLPVDSLFVLNGRIPRPVVMKRGSFRSGEWISTLGNVDKDPFCKFLSQMKHQSLGGFDKQFRWDLSLGRSTIKLQWAVQLVPMSEESFLFLIHQPFETTLFSEYKSSHVQKSLQLAEWIQAVIVKAKYTGTVGQTRLLIPTLSVLALQNTTEEGE